MWLEVRNERNKMNEEYKEYRECKDAAREDMVEAFDRVIDGLLLNRDGEKSSEEGYDEHKESELLLAPVFKDPQALATLIAGLTQASVQAYWAEQLDQSITKIRKAINEA